MSIRFELLKGYVICMLIDSLMAVRKDIRLDLWAKLMLLPFLSILILQMNILRVVKIIGMITLKIEYSKVKKKYCKN